MSYPLKVWQSDGLFKGTRQRRIRYLNNLFLDSKIEFQ